MSAVVQLGTMAAVLLYFREDLWRICRCGTYNRVRAAIKLAAEGGEARRG